MEIPTETRQALTRYLLGDAAAEEQTALEERYFSDPRVFDQLVAVENDLADRYARNQLPREERARFERHYLAHPSRRARSQFASALAAALDEPAPGRAAPQPESWWRQLLQGLRSPVLVAGLAAAMLLLTLAGAWLLAERNRLRSELAESRAAQSSVETRERELQTAIASERQRSERIASELEQLRAQQAKPAVASFVSLLLTAGMVRDGGGDTPRLTIPAGVEQIRLQLKVNQNDYPRYRIALQSAAGRTLRGFANLKPAGGKTGAVFSLSLPARLFDNGEYVLALSGVNADGEADALSKTLFRLEKK